MERAGNDKRWDDLSMSSDLKLAQLETTPWAVLHDCIETEISRGDQTSIVRLVDLLIEEAYVLRASDIHLDPTENIIAVRFRIDGVIETKHELLLVKLSEIISRLKIMCGLRTDEHQAAQDGRARVVLPYGKNIDIRVSIMPLYYGENAVIRLLVIGVETFTLSSLGFSTSNQEKIMSAVTKPYGMILATGPTGSGKTTTLYTLLQLQNIATTSIVTIEDPIEYAILGVNQIQVNSRTGLSFANGLRSILRQDPNTIMVGEIRDNETAGLAVNVALTGHLVFSTLHTSDAATTLPRLLDMKIEPYLIASTVNVAIGQRLVRRLCVVCKSKKQLSAVDVELIKSVVGIDIDYTSGGIYERVGCATCNQTGYYGRIGVHEVLVMSETIREAVVQNTPARIIRNLAISEGMVPLLVDGFLKVLAGETNLEEVLKINYE